MGLSGIGNSTVSKLCKDIDERVGAFLNRPLVGDWPYLWLDATYLKQREGGRIVSVAAIIAVAANAEGKNASRPWSPRHCVRRFCNRTRRRRDRPGGMSPISSVLAGPGDFAARNAELGAFMDSSEHDVLAYMGFPIQHRAKLRSTNPLERLNKEVKRRADVVGIFPGESSMVRLIGAVLLEQNDEWQLQQRYMQVEAMAELLPPLIEGEAIPADDAQITPQAA